MNSAPHLQIGVLFSQSIPLHTGVLSSFVEKCSGQTNSKKHPNQHERSLILLNCPFQPKTRGGVYRSHEGCHLTKLHRQANLGMRTFTCFHTLMAVFKLKMHAGSQIAVMSFLVCSFVCQWTPHLPPPHESKAASQICMLKTRRKVPLEQHILFHEASKAIKHFSLVVPPPKKNRRGRRLLILSVRGW